jgi:nitrite reductase (cytochrome c-552)
MAGEKDNGTGWGWWTPRRMFVISVLIGVVALGSAAVTAGLAAFMLNIESHKVEARNPFYRVVEITDDTDDPEIWGKNFPFQYDGYKRTADMVRTRYGGSEAMPRTPTEADPRSVVAQSRLEEDPRLITMWAGYAFAKDFREERGHWYMLDDQVYTERQKVVKQPGTCINCHASVYTAYKRLGGGDIVKGFEALNKMPYFDAKKEVKHPVACIDCHDPATMQLRITRPAFMEGIRAAKAAEGIQNYDVNKQASRQEMRSFVCGQCHVEYYFKGEEKRLTYPWHKGLKADEILAYYEENGHKDWVHAESGAPALKAQHPEFETWNQGVHARSGVACADCHMPYKREGAMKISDHQVRSPLLNINRACQTCHKFPEEEMKARVELIQSRTREMRDTVMNTLVALIADIKLAKETGVSEEILANARGCQRRGQFLLDFVEAENSCGFHAPQEAARILLKSLNHLREGQNALRVMAAAAPASAPVVGQ